MVHLWYIEFGSAVVVDGSLVALVVDSSLVGTTLVVDGSLVGTTLVVDGSLVVGCCATLEGFSDHSWYSGRARNRFTLPHVRHLTTKCLSR